MRAHAASGGGEGGVARHPTIEPKTRTMREPHRTRLICINCARTEALCKSIQCHSPFPSLTHTHTLLQLHTLEQRRAIWLLNGRIGSHMRQMCAISRQPWKMHENSINCCIMQQQRSRRRRRHRSRSQTVQFAQINYLQLKQLEYNGNWPQNVRKSLKTKQSRNFLEYLVES